jgi:hypothetical protein
MLENIKRRQTLAAAYQDKEKLVEILASGQAKSYTKALMILSEREAEEERECDEALLQEIALGENAIIGF